MNKLLFYFLLLPTFIFASSISEKQIVLSSISFNLEFNFSDTTSEVRILDSEKKIILVLQNVNNLDEITIKKSGDYYVYQNDIEIGKIVVLPGWLSIIPPLIAILLALIFKEVLLALFAGIFVGAFFIYDFNFLSAFLRLIDTILISVIADVDHIFIILFTMLIGGVVGIISSNGGTVGLANKIIQWAKTPRTGMIASWFMGVLIFFDDYANSLLVGNMMRPITDKLKISREKLAYIVDSTAAPVASLVVISTWIGYELGLITDSLKIVEAQISAYDVFLNSLVYRFYPIATLIFVFMITYTKRDFGPMLKVEKLARSGKYTFTEIGNKSEDAKKLFEIKSPKWFNAVIPILIILIITLIGLIYTGKMELENSGITEYGIREIISNSNSYSALLWGSFTASVFAIIITVAQRIKKLGEVFEDFLTGLRSMLIAVVILIFAWGISLITAELHTADFLISIMIDSVDIRMISTLVFIVAALTSFSTGTSWGTMAIIMPIVIPLTWQLGEVNNLLISEIHTYVFSVVGAVLAGSVFGDHCSPIADTTILSSLASSCNHIEHVRTQLPYAILVGITTLVFGNLATAFGMPLWIVYPLIIGILYLVLFTKGEVVN